MRKAFGRLQLRAGGKDAKGAANGKDAGRPESVQQQPQPAESSMPTSQEYVRQEVDDGAAASTGIATHSSKESRADIGDYDNRPHDDGYAPP